MMYSEDLCESFYVDDNGNEIEREESRERKENRIVENSLSAIDLILNLEKEGFSDTEISEIVAREYSAESLAEYLYDFVIQATKPEKV